MPTLRDPTPLSSLCLLARRRHRRWAPHVAFAMAAVGSAACGPAVDLESDGGSSTTAAAGSTVTGTPDPIATSTTDSPGTTTTPPTPPTITAPPPTTAPPPETASETASDASGGETDGGVGVDCEPSDEWLAVVVEPVGGWEPQTITTFDTTCVVEDDYHGGQIVRHLLHCEEEGSDVPVVVRVELRWTGDFRNPLLDGELMRLRAVSGESKDGLRYATAAVHDLEGALRLASHTWPVPRWADADPLAWLGLDVEALEDACGDVGAGGGGGFIPDPCGATNVPMAVRISDGLQDVTIADRNLDSLGDWAISVRAENWEWEDPTCDFHDTYELSISGPDL